MFGAEFATTQAVRKEMTVTSVSSLLADANLPSASRKVELTVRCWQQASLLGPELSASLPQPAPFKFLLGAWKGESHLMHSCHAELTTL